MPPSPRRHLSCPSLGLVVSTRTAKVRPTFLSYSPHPQIWKLTFVPLAHTSSTQRTTPSRPPSIQSKRSISSNLSSMLRRATSRRSSSTSRDRDQSDTNSMFSVGSMSSGMIQRRLFTRPLHKQTSELSLRTDSSPFDSASISSHVKSARGGIATEPTTPSSPSLSRTTTRSARRLPKAAPPSSFHGRVVGLDPPNGRSSGLDITTDSEQLKTARDIRHEIESVEAEGRRLLDAFNGLELSTLTRRQHRPGPLTPNASSSHLAVPGTHPSDLQDPLDSSWTLIPDRRSRFRKDSDSTSVRSSGSNGTSLSDYRSPTRSRPKGGSPLVAQPVSLGRKSSFASVSSRGRSASTSAPALPSSSTSVIGRLGSASSSSLNLSRSASHLPLATVAEGDGRESVDGHRAWPGLSAPAGHAKSASVTPRSATSAAGDDAELAALEVEMADIRRRRTEVVGRYEERLEYLRAKLKGAELHEKLLRQ